MSTASESPAALRSAPVPDRGLDRALFVSWTRHHGRSEDLARRLGAECAFVAVGRLTHRPTAPFRHLVQAVLTVLLLVRRRPRVLLVMAPPWPLVAIGLAWRGLTRGRLVVDCHSAAVLGRPLSARLAQHADAAVVTLPELADQVPGALALHDVVDPVSAAPLHDEVVLPASWYADEPTSDVLAAAELLPHVAFAITGRSPAGLAVPANVRLTGFLPRSDYLRLLAGAPVVLALTTRESTMQRAAYEALSAGRPVVASATRALGDYLGEAAVLAGRGGPALAAALTEALERREELAAAAVRVRAVRAAEQEQALARLVGRVSG